MSRKEQGLSRKNVTVHGIHHARKDYSVPLTEAPTPEGIPVDVDELSKEIEARSKGQFVRSGSSYRKLHRKH